MITRAQARDRISHSGPYFVGLKQKTFKNVVQYCSTDIIDMSVVDKFLLSINKWKCLFFDTESNGKLKFNVPPNKGQEGRIPVVFGNPDGLVLIFHDARMVPQKIKDICADFGYVKFQSGIEKDIELLKPFGFTFRGIVDVQTLMALGNPASDKSGIEECTRFVWQTASKPTKEFRIKWITKFNNYYIRENMEEECLAHSVQDVLVPYAIALKVAIEIARARGLDSASDDIFPILNEAFELAMSKAPADIRNDKTGYLKLNINDNWIKDDDPKFDTPFQFNSHHIIQRIRCARGDLVEVVESGLTQEQVINRARRHLKLLKNRLPPSSEMSFSDFRFHIMDHCAHCGSQDHKAEACTDRLAVPCQ